MKRFLLSLALWCVGVTFGIQISAGDNAYGRAALSGVLILLAILLAVSSSRRTE